MRFAEEYISHLGSLKDRYTSKRRLGEELRRLAVGGMVELRNLDLHPVVLRSDQRLERTEVGRVRPELLLCTSQLEQSSGM